MKPTYVPSLTEQQLAELDELYRTTKSPRLRTRAQMVLLSAEKGLKVQEIAEIVRESQATVLRWLKRYMAEGVEGLKDMPRAGRPGIVTDAYRAELVEAVRRRPRSLGQPYSLWTLHRVGKHRGSIHQGFPAQSRLRSGSWRSIDGRYLHGSSDQRRASAAQSPTCRHVVESGGKVLLGGRRPQIPELVDGYYFEPAVIEGVDASSEPVMEETLGPVTLLFRVGDLHQAVDLANSTAYGLSMAIFSKDIDVGTSVAEHLDCGVAWINAGTVGAEVGLQFGGAKDTGIGTSEWGQGALDTFSRWKTTYINYSGEHRYVFEDTQYKVTK